MLKHKFDNNLGNDLLEIQQVNVRVCVDFLASQTKNFVLSHGNMEISPKVNPLPRMEEFLSNIHVFGTDTLAQKKAFRKGKLRIQEV